MNKQISPAVATTIVIVVVLVIGVWLYFRARSSQPKYGAEIPEVVMKEYKEKGPRPMPPIPMPGGGSIPTPSGPPVGAAGTK